MYVFIFQIGALIAFSTIQHVHSISERKFSGELSAHRNIDSGSVDGGDVIGISRPYSEDDTTASHKIQPLKHHTTQIAAAKDATGADTASIVIPDVSSNEQILYFENTNVNKNNNNMKRKSKPYLF